MKTKILLLPGMGDIYWVATILQAFCADRGIDTPLVYIWDFDGRRRSADFVRRIPFVEFGGYWEHSQAVPEFEEVYKQRGRWAIENFQGFDYLISLNGWLRNGAPIAATGYAPDWHFPLIETEKEKRPTQYGDYFVVHFSEFGMFDKWVAAWGLDGCARFISRLQARATVLLTGCKWDKPFSDRLAGRTGAVNLCGDTDMDEFFGLFRGAAGCAGWCGGNTIVAAALKIPTLILWSHYFNDARFFANAAAPGSQWAIVEQMNPDQAAQKFLNHVPG